MRFEVLYQGEIEKSLWITVKQEKVRLQGNCNSTNFISKKVTTKRRNEREDNTETKKQKKVTKLVTDRILSMDFS